MFLRRLYAVIALASFLLTSFGPINPILMTQAAELNLPAPGTMVNLSPAFEPPMIKGLTIHKDNPFLFDFIVDTAHSGLAGEQLKSEGDRLVKYFFACLTIPEKDLWVNLSPYEKDRMVPQALGQTALGRDLLAQDYILKQLTASLIYPEKNLGKEFWDRVYTKAREMYGTTQIPVNTFNKVWIVADKANVYEHGQTAFVVDGHLKVMLEEDYIALQKHSANLPSAQSTNASSIGSNIVRQIILPEIEKEVNTGKNFSTLRQIFNSLILASWYKKNLKEALINQVYTDKSTVKGVNLADPSVKERIYQQYLKAYKKGVFNYIKEEPNADGQTIPRKYFSGGFDSALLVNVAHDPSMGARVEVINAYRMRTVLTTTDTAMRAAISDITVKLPLTKLSRRIAYTALNNYFNINVQRSELDKQEHKHHPDRISTLDQEIIDMIQKAKEENNTPEGLLSNKWFTVYVPSSNRSIVIKFPKAAYLLNPLNKRASRVRITISDKAMIGSKVVWSVISDSGLKDHSRVLVVQGSNQQTRTIKLKLEDVQVDNVRKVPAVFMTNDGVLTSPGGYNETYINATSDQILKDARLDEGMLVNLNNNPYTPEELRIFIKYFKLGRAHPALRKIQGALFIPMQTNLRIIQDLIADFNSKENGSGAGIGKNLVLSSEPAGLNILLEGRVTGNVTKDLNTGVNFVETWLNKLSLDKAMTSFDEEVQAYVNDHGFLETMNEYKSSKPVIESIEAIWDALVEFSKRPGTKIYLSHADDRFEMVTPQDALNIITQQESNVTFKAALVSRSNTGGKEYTRMFLDISYDGGLPVEDVKPPKPKVLQTQAKGPVVKKENKARKPVAVKSPKESELATVGSLPDKGEIPFKSDKDAAMLDPGGIDLNTADMGMTVTRDAYGGVQVNFDPAMAARVRQQGIQSAVPVIINVTPMTSAEMNPLLGINGNS